MLERLCGQAPSIMPKVSGLLAEWGVKVEAIYPERLLTDLARLHPQHDVYILKSGTDLAFSIAGALHALGATILDPYPVAALMRNKIIAARILKRAGIPTPDCYVTAHPEQLARLLAGGPLVVKPYQGSHGRGVRVIWDVDELDDVPTNQGGPVFAQRYHKPDGPDRKIYCIGGQMFGVERIWPAQTYEEKLGRPFTLSPELHDIALRCGRAFGVDLYGLDVIISDGRPYVVDVNSFPGFKGVPDVALRVADYVFAAAQRACADRALERAANTKVVHL